MKWLFEFVGLVVGAGVGYLLQMQFALMKQELLLPVVLGAVCAMIAMFVYDRSHERKHQRYIERMRERRRTPKQ